MERDTDVLDLYVGIMVRVRRYFCCTMEEYGILLGGANPCEFLLRHSVKTLPRVRENKEAPLNQPVKAIRIK